MPMSTRLQVIFDEEELEELKERARKEKITVSDWVRRAVRNEMRSRPGEAARKKLDIIRAYSRYDYPSGDYELIAAEIESGYRTGSDQ